MKKKKSKLQNSVYNVLPFVIKYMFRYLDIKYISRHLYLGMLSKVSYVP